MTLSLPELTTVNGYIRIKNNAALTEISFPVLTTVSEIYLSDNVSLNDCDLGSYTNSDCP